MPKDLNATCSICGKGYHLCMTCNEVKSFTPWRSIVDTVNCYKIFLSIKDYTNKAKTKEIAKSELVRFDLSEVDDFVPEIRDVVKEILSEDKLKKIRTLSRLEKDSVLENE